VTATIRALTLLGNRKLELRQVPGPPPPAAGEVQIAVKAVALNHIDVWGFRGMAFAKRKMPVVVGVEAAGEIAQTGAGVTAFKRFNQSLPVELLDSIRKNKVAIKGPITTITDRPGLGVDVDWHLVSELSDTGDA
jgi:L-alanine-DL-glutamate epimerase-like enolase superfamily enzyme